MQCTSSLAIHKKWEQHVIEIVKEDEQGKLGTKCFFHLPLILENKILGIHVINMQPLKALESWVLVNFLAL